jgi:hypothetical protein
MCSTISACFSYLVDSTKLGSGLIRPFVSLLLRFRIERVCDLETSVGDVSDGKEIES